MSWDLLVSNGDLALNNGDLTTITGQQKLIQDILKICLTTAGSNIMQPWYGSFLSRTLIGSTLDTDITTTMAKSQLQNALESLKKLQQLQLMNTLQEVSPDEHIAGISDIQVNRNKFDPRIFEVLIKVLSRSFTQSTVKFDVTNS